MYSKDELSAKNISELQAIANEMGAEATDGLNEESLMYAILDKQAEIGSMKNPLAAKRRRTRIVKKDTDRVYTVSGKEGENFDVKKTKTTQTNGVTSEEEQQEEIEKRELTPEEMLMAIPKHRGRKSKKELELLSAIEARKKQNELLAGNKDTETTTEEPINTNVTEMDNSENTEIAPSSNTTDEIPEASFTPKSENENDNDSNKSELIAKLQEKINAHNENNDYAEDKQQPIDNSVWEGDPGDGTDFITVVDLPIEDQGVVPNYDMFDNPTMQPNDQHDNYEQPEEEEPLYDFTDLITANGVLEVMPDGYGFLRSSDYNYLSSPDDVYVSTQQIKNYGLKTGDVIECHVRPPHDGEKYFPLTSIDMINGREPMDVRDRIAFEHLTPLFPEEKFNLCGEKKTTNLSTRIVDLFSPIGKGQRALIVAQPKTGKTILMKDIAKAIAANHPEA